MSNEESKQVLLQKIYLKDASVEIPLAPAVFTRQWQPQVDVQLQTAAKPMNDESVEVVLSVTVTTKLGDDTAFLIEVHQAGLFAVRGFDKDSEERRAVLGAYCPNLLFPFAREAVADLVQRAGFPQLLLQPVNFDALYLEHRKRAAAEPGAETTPAAADGVARAH
ncbi:MAG: protein-export chaperone SecB [Pseudomonadota bacterium]|nr:protein-export chaperone SecB [Gammaproteobacteria bacterium]MEC9357103.1 protein-export chaperone SecB [Pseudomonadota bacterium]